MAGQDMRCRTRYDGSLEKMDVPIHLKTIAPVKDWWQGFVKRHPEMTERMPQHLGKERAIITEEKIERWFTDYEQYITSEIKEPTLLQDPSRLYNADESGFTLCPKSGKILAKKGSSTVYNFGSSDKSQITVLACMSATGHFLRPLIVYPGQRFAYNPLEGFTEAVMGRTDNGWMDSDLFAVWLNDVFIPSINERGVRKPVVLFVDGHSTHVTMAVSNICKKNGVELYCLLEHASHLMQPCDLRLFSGLKHAWKQSVRDYQFHNIGEHVTKRTFAGVFKTAWQKSTTLSSAVHGFRDAGLFPLDISRVLATKKMESSQIFCQKPMSVVTNSGAADILTDTQMSTSDAAPLGIPHDVPADVSKRVDAPKDVPTSSPVATTACLPVRAFLACKDQENVSPAVEAVLKSPTAKQTANRQVTRESMPKAVTGERFRQILEEKRERKEKEEADKKERKKLREQKKLEKEEEKKKKQEQIEAKRKSREAQRQRKIQEKEMTELEKQKRKREISSSDSDRDMSDLSDGSDMPIEIKARECYTCEQPYDDSPFWIFCHRCPRLFHRRCVKSIDLCVMAEEEIEALQFECDFC